MKNAEVTDSLVLARLRDAVRVSLGLADDDIVLISALHTRSRDGSDETVVVTMQPDSLRTWRILGSPGTITTADLESTLIQSPDGVGPMGAERS